jgi:hypothetical protein
MYRFEDMNANELYRLVVLIDSVIRLLPGTMGCRKLAS